MLNLKGKEEIEKKGKSTKPSIIITCNAAVILFTIILWTPRIGTFWSMAKAEGEEVDAGFTEGTGGVFVC